VNFIATCVFGLEAIVGREIQKLGYEKTNVTNGSVEFKGDLQAICKSNIWLRTAERVVVKIGSFKATTFEELFQGVKALPWEEWIPKDGRFPVIGKSISSKLFSISDCQAITKKAIVERLKQKYSIEWFEETGPTYKVEVGFLKDIATLTIDTSGTGLHKRGYRTLVSKAPLKETLASALIQISRWREDRSFIDPFCGSGTIPIEAAMIAKNIAPGLKREFVSESFVQLSKEMWAREREEANSLIKGSGEYFIQGSDIDEEVLGLARYHSKLAGVEDIIHLQRRDVAEINSKKKYGFLITNPPYGERMSGENELIDIYKRIKDAFSRLDTWSFYVLTSDTRIEEALGRRANKKRKLYNGMIKCDYYQYYGPKPKRLNIVEK
jgi:putative N6-adenine-specific DNA methylase